jgi:diaminohydroxyphosphoribosylaminopyrimidine deaminase/5-amino-6-(5-phosphoribosylamino)uracil reductase
MPLFSDLSEEVADPLLRRAFVLAERGRGATSPNPVVGCVIARGDEVVGEGFHARAGGPHAEIAALEAAGEKAIGADVYVTLEPCNHYGRTPPCVTRLLQAEVASVTVGMRDPNPEVSGGGAEALQAAGVRVAWAQDPHPFEAQNEAWLKFLASALPFVRVKVGLTLDGRAAIFASKRSKITGAGGRAVTMRLRAESSAVAVGAATLTVDDPALTIRDRDDRPADRQPARFVLARTSLPSARARVFSDGGTRATVIVGDTAPSAGLTALRSAGIPVATYPYNDGLSGILSQIARAGAYDVLIEAGPALLSSLWREGLIDELIMVAAGGMAGNAAPPLYLGRPDATGTDLEAQMHAVEAGVVDGDAVTVWRPGAKDEVGLRKGSA